MFCGVKILAQLNTQNTVPTMEAAFQLIGEQDLPSYEYLDNQKLVFYYTHLTSIQY